MSPIQFFSELPSDGEESKKRAMLIDGAFPNCACESHTLSSFSHGPVLDKEFIFRYVFSPIHIENDGTVKPAAFGDVENKGLSCDRSPISTAHNDIHERGVAQVENYNRENPLKPQRTYLGAVNAECKSIRQILKEDGSRAFAVYDTALINNCDHVDVFHILLNTSPGSRKLLRKRLRDKFTKTPTR